MVTVNWFKGWFTLAEEPWLFPLSSGTAPLQKLALEKGQGRGLLVHPQALRTAARGDPETF